MKKNNEKSEFLSKAEAFAKEMSEKVNADGVKRSVIILATETIDGENDTRQIIGVAGNGREIIQSIAKFANQEDIKPLLKKGLELSMIEAIAQKSGGGIIKINRFINN